MRPNECVFWQIFFGFGVYGFAYLGEEGDQTKVLLLRTVVPA